MSINIKKMTYSHVEECSRIICSSIIGQKYGYTEEKIKNMLIKAIENDENIYSGLLGEKIVGLVWYDLKGAFCISPYLRLIVVDEECKGMKVGTSLIDFYEEQCKAANKKYFLLVSDFNVHAIEFYKNKGYKEIGIIPSYVNKEINEIIMMKENKSII